VTRVNGFTLVELLAAMVAGSLLLVAVGAMTGSMAREVRQADSRKDASRVASVAPLLDRLIAGLQPTGDDRSLVEVTPQALSGVIEPLQVFGPVGPIHMTLDVRRSGAGEALFLQLASEGEGAALPRAATQAVKLVDGFRSIRFTVPLSQGSGYQPSDGALAIEFTSMKGGQRRLAFIPRVTTSGECRFDPISLACR